MTTYAARYPFAVPLTLIGNVLRRGAALLHAAARGLAARRRIADDWDALAAMSERELRDIGISRASLAPIAQGDWMREYPR